MIIRVVTGVAGTIPQRTFESGYESSYIGRTANQNFSTQSYSAIGYYGGETFRSGGSTRVDDLGTTARDTTVIVYTDGSSTSRVDSFERTRYTYTALGFVSYNTTSRPLVAGEGDLFFSTTTVTIPSAKVASVGTYTFLSQTTGSTTTSRFLLTNFTQKTTGSTTADGSAVYETVTRGGASLQTYATTRWEVFDNSDNNSVFRVVAGQGGLPSYEELQDGFVIGEAGYDVEVGQVVVGTYNGSGSVNGTVETTAPTSQGTRSWTEYVTSESSYEATEEVWEPYQTTREGWTDTTLATTTELFGTETDTTVDTGTTYIETYEDYSSTTRWAGYAIYDTVTETSQVTVYRFTKTANRALIGTKPQIGTYRETVTDYKTTTSSTSFQEAVGNKTLGTGLEWDASKANSFVAAIPKDQGAIVGFAYSTTRQTTINRNSSQVYSLTAFTFPEQVVIYSDERYEGNFISSFQTSSGINSNASPLIAGAAIENFLLEPVGPPAIGGVHRSGRALELVDNCPHTFPAILLWQGVHETIHAAAFASSFYEGGVPLISHNTPWEHESRTYNWITADGARGTLKVQGAVNSTSQSSTTFTIGVDGQCDYTGGKQTSQAGGEYFSSRKATLVANCPAVVSIEGGTKTFGVGTHEITEPMRFDIRQAGSVIAPGIVVIGPTYSPYQNVFITA